MAENIAPATQKFVDIKEIKNSVVYLKNGGLRQILIVSGVNFDLKSEAEQTIILNSFQNFLNTLDFSVQFFIHSRKVNVNDYLEKIEGRRQSETNELLKIQIEEYINFIRAFVEENAIITKSFFVTVPYETGITNSGAKGIFSLFNFKTKPAAGAEEKANAEEKLEQLSHRVNQVASGLQQIGLRVAVLNDEELIELFYNLYNPQLVEKKGLEIAKK
ncbi:MAG: TraC family protein [Patescibacteria group bacterium]